MSSNFPICFREAEIFVIFAIKQLVKISLSQNFLLTSRAQFLRVADPVTRQKIDLIVVEASSKLRKFLRRMIKSLVVTATANRSSCLIAPSLWHGSFRQQRATRFDKRGTVDSSCVGKVRNPGSVTEIS